MRNYTRRTEVTSVTELNVGGDYIEKLNEVVHNLIKESEKRAEANGRRTVYARDL